MTNKWNDKSWQKDFLNMKSYSPSDAKLLMGGVKGLKDAWRLGVLHVEYERLKKKLLFDLFSLFIFQNGLINFQQNEQI